MSCRDFSTSEFAQRREALTEQLHRNKIDWFIAIHPRSIHWLTGSRAKSYQSFQCLFVSAAGGLPVLIARRSDQLELEADALVKEIRFWGDSQVPDAETALVRAFGDLRLRGRTLALDQPDHFPGTDLFQSLVRRHGAKTLNGTALLRDVRLIKSPAEQKYIRKAGEIADLSMAALQDGLRIGKTELSLTGNIYQAALQAGGDLPASPINIAAGARGLFCHAAPSERPVRDKDHGNAEYAVPYRGYPASIGRQFCIGQPAQALTDTLGYVKEALQAAILGCTSGVPARDVFFSANEVLKRHGLDQARAHTMGYAMATAFPPAMGETFQIAPDNHEPLRSGMQFSICPNVFSPKANLGVRLVNNILVHDTAAEVVTRFPLDLIEARS
ncbi:MAG: Xaa-Pro peptidase family protein [Sulfitobacter sp.]